MVNAETVGVITALHGTNDGTPTDLSGIGNVIRSECGKERKVIRISENSRRMKMIHFCHSGNSDRIFLWIHSRMNVLCPIGRINTLKKLYQYE